MTTADLRKPPPGTAPEPPAPRRWQALRVGLRLAHLHMASRRVPSGLAILAGCGAVLWVALRWRWTVGSGTGAQSIPVILEAGAACVVTVATWSPFGEPERVTARWLPYLRLGVTVAMTAAAVGALAAGSAIAGGLDGGILDLLRNVAGFTGIGLVLAAVTGAGLAWTGPLAYMVVAEFAILELWTTPLVWPARPPHDRGGAICAALVFAAGIAAVTIYGARDSARDQR
jgi:hypothetical protein